MRSSRFFFVLAATLGATGIALGAFGAHALRERLVAAGTTAIWDKAVLYHLIHAVAVLVIAAYPTRSARVTDPWAARACAAWAVGVLFFSGSLYGLALGGPRWLGPITPLGGLAMIAGWICVALAGRRTEERNEAPR